MNTSILRPLVLLIGIAFVATIGGADAHGQAVSEERQLHVSGRGVVHVAPDTATVRFAVETRADEADAARVENERASAAALEAVRELGVPEREIRMESLQLRPLRRYDEPNRRYVEDGFEAVRDVSVVIDDLELLPQIVAALFERGANRLRSVSYDISDRSEATDDALRKAVAEARRKALAMLEPLDAELARVHTVREQSFSFPRPMVRADQLQVESAEPEAYASGDIEVTASVDLVFDLR